MAGAQSRTDLIRDAILEHVGSHPKDIVRFISERFGVSRQGVSHHVQALIAKGLLEPIGKTKARRYELKLLVNEIFRLPVTPDLQEDVVWRERVQPLIGQVPESVLAICEYGFTEMLNNVISHSEGNTVTVRLGRQGIWITMTVIDYGVGIFEKIQRELHLNDSRHALLELAKGKLTTDQRSHTGEGVFFTSRMFDKFSILSSTLFYSRERTDEDEWLIEAENHDKTTGTMVEMEIKINSPVTVKEVFEKYASGQDDYRFARTHVPIKLAKYEHDQLISRSAARRVLARFDKFQEVILDFQGVETIGQAFADEIFRVFKREHPDIRVYVVNAAPSVESMIQHARQNELAMT
ncbi:MAG: DUF4325 domain-containing protein [Chloroflexi bacterium]|nr:DUF4325 domain-containing protein [Chloroflexota bacterium]